MHAVIMQSCYDTTWGEKVVRQTTIIPMVANPVTGQARPPRVYTRTAATRGVNGSWTEATPPFLLGEVVLGDVGIIRLTQNNIEYLEFPITPQTVMQRLLRELGESPAITTTNAKDMFYSMLSDASNAPYNLPLYALGVKGPASNTPVVTQPEPTEPAVETTTEPIQISEQYVEIPIPTITHNQESEAMVDNTMTFQSTTQVTESASVLTVPDVQTYFPRVHFGKTEDEVLSYAQRTQQAVLLTGPAGTGKTSAARHFAATHRLPFEVVECTQQIDQTVTQGRFIATADGGVRWLDSRLATAFQQPSVVLFNELTRMPAKAASLFLRALEERELAIEPLNKVIKIHPECLIVADQNTGYGYTGTSKQDAALIDRFNIKLEFKYDTEIESKFIKSPALLAFADGIRTSADSADEFTVPMSTRVLINFQAQAQNLGFEFAVNSLLNNFPKMDGEREAIKMRFDADALTIANELGVEYSQYDAN